RWTVGWTGGRLTVPDGRVTCVAGRAHRPRARGPWLGGVAGWLRVRPWRGRGWSPGLVGRSESARWKGARAEPDTAGSRRCDGMTVRWANDPNLTSALSPVSRPHRHDSKARDR